MIWVNKSDSFDAANEFDDDYYLSMSREERLETLQFLREIYFKIKKGSEDESRKGLRRVIKIIE
jgi:DNA polymerase III delta subunit